MTDLVQMGKEMDKPARILFVDDEEVYRETMAEWLKSWNYEVEQAENGDQALQMISDQKFDLIITDFVMPGLDGLGLLKAIRAEDSLIPVLIVTGYDDRLSQLSNIENNVTSVASKTIDLTILHDHIKRLVRRW